MNRDIPRLSDLILEGDILKMPSNAVILSSPAPAFKNLRVGCAFGGYLVARGLDRLWDYSEGEVLYIVQQDYPWLRSWHLKELTRMYGEVLAGDMTIIQLASEVRRWEDLAELGDAMAA